VHERDKGAWDPFSQNVIAAHQSDLDYRMSWRFMTGLTSLPSFTSSSTCVPSSFPLSPPTSPMTVLNDEVDEILEEADTGYEEDMQVIQTNYDRRWNIEFHPGRKGSQGKEDDFTYARRIFSYTENERERAERGVLPKNLHDFSEKVCHIL
jgi:hypothetical protein